MSDELLAALDVKLDVFANALREEMRAQGEDLRGEMRAQGDGVGQRIAGLDQRISDLDRHMHVLYEDTVDKIKALAPDFGPIERKFRQADANLREEFDGRLRPLEAERRKRP